MIIVDAYNVLHLPDAAAAGAGIDLVRLCGLIGTSRYARERVLLVCDGRPHPSLGLAVRPGGAARGRVAGMEVLFSGALRSADDEIEERLGRGAGSGVTVVSDDRRLRRAAGRAGARSLPSATFLAHLLVDGSGRAGPRLPGFARDIPLDPYSVAHWLDEFGLARGAPAGIPVSAPSKVSQGRRPPAPAGSPSATERPDSPPRDEPRPSDPGASRLQAIAEDPVIREALEAWKGRLSLEDLDMQRWLQLRPPDGPAGRG